MGVVTLLISVINLLLITFGGFSWVYEELTKFVFYYGKYGSDVFAHTSWSFWLVDLSIPFLLIFLTFYVLLNFNLLKSLSRNFFRIGLIISLVVTIAGLTLGILLEWGSFSLSRGGFNQGIASIFFIPLILQLVVVLLYRPNN